MARSSPLVLDVATEAKTLGWSRRFDQDHFDYARQVVMPGMRAFATALRGAQPRTPARKVGWSHQQEVGRLERTGTWNPSPPGSRLGEPHDLRWKDVDRLARWAVVVPGIWAAELALTAVASSDRKSNRAQTVLQALGRIQLAAVVDLGDLARVVPIARARPDGTRRDGTVRARGLFLLSRETELEEELEGSGIGKLLCVSTGEKVRDRDTEAAAGEGASPALTVPSARVPSDPAARDGGLTFEEVLDQLEIEGAPFDGC
jgi:hypothetical protein